MSGVGRVAVVVVAYRNPADLRACLGALDHAEPSPAFEVHVTENGGAGAYDALLAALTAADGPCDTALDPAPIPPRARRARSLRLRTSGRAVRIAEAEGNLGYAGGVNLWLAALAAAPGWDGLWILNPDALPAPDALAALRRHDEARGLALTGSRLVSAADPGRVLSRGLRWRRLRAGTLAVDRLAPASPPPADDEIEARLHAPSGASIYGSRTALARLGPMDESFFLYFEDLDWGLRAKRLTGTPAGVGYAHDSLVVHDGGTTIGSAPGRAGRSRLAVFLDHRNRVLFTRKHDPRLVPWTAIMGVVSAGEFLLAGSPRGARAALAGVAAGLRGETGPPPFLAEATVPPNPVVPARERPA